MSKVFEALQRLERDSGTQPAGLMAEARQVFQNGAPAPVSVPPTEAFERVVEDVLPLPGIDPDRAGSDSVEPVFAVDRIPVETAAITPATRAVYYTDPDGAAADRFRLLRMRLRPIWESGKLKTLLVTSAQAHDGKSTVVMNLATALSEQGKRSVLVIEGDLYHPSLTQRLGLANREGLAECLESGRNPLSLLRKIEPLGWYLLSAGVPRSNPTELLQSPTLSGIFDAVRPHFDWIIVDTPPVVPLTDTLSLRQYVEAALVVVRADRTPQDAVEAAITRIGAKHLLGVILNGAEDLERLYSEYGKSYGLKNK